MQKKTLSFRLRIWRQPRAEVAGKLVDYNISDLYPDLSVMEMLDKLKGVEGVENISLTMQEQLLEV